MRKKNPVLIILILFIILCFSYGIIYMFFSPQSLLFSNQQESDSVIETMISNKKTINRIEIYPIPPGNYTIYYDTENECIISDFEAPVDAFLSTQSGYPFQVECLTNDVWEPILNSNDEISSLNFNSSNNSISYYPNVSDFSYRVFDLDHKAEFDTGLTWVNGWISDDLIFGGQGNSTFSFSDNTGKIPIKLSGFPEDCSIFSLINFGENNQLGILGCNIPDTEFLLFSSIFENETLIYGETLFKFGTNRLALRHSHIDEIKIIEESDSDLFLYNIKNQCFYSFSLEDTFNINPSTINWNDDYLMFNTYPDQNSEYFSDMALVRIPNDHEFITEMLAPENCIEFNDFIE